MTEAVRFTSGASAEEDILGHLRSCDLLFAVPLSERVDLAAYARKLHAAARTFEAWAADELVGLVAAYVNSAEGTAFVSSVSVLEEYSRRGIAGRLLDDLLARARAERIDCISLEVSEQSAAAVRLYERFGFETVERRDGNLSMKCRLVTTERPPKEPTRDVCP